MTPPRATVPSTPARATRRHAAGYRVPPERPRIIEVDGEIGEISACSIRPRGARWIYLLGHGAGAGMNHEFLAAVATRLARRGVATLRYQFPYMEAGRKPPDRAPVLIATVRAAIAAARRFFRLPLIVGGKSMGGRMTSLALADRPDPRVRGLAFLGFPLHPAGRPGDERGEHLRRIKTPMLFVQGTRDQLAYLDLVRPLCASLGRRARLHVVDGGDHSFKVLRRSGRTDDQALDEVADAVTAWGDRVLRRKR